MTKGVFGNRRILRRGWYVIGICLAVAAPVHAAGPLPVIWDETQRGKPLAMAGLQLAFAEEFDSPLSLRGPKLFAPVHAPFGASVFEEPEGQAYSVTAVASDAAGEAPLGVLKLTATRTAQGWRSGNVQTADAEQSYRGRNFDGRGFLGRNCYFEARIKFPAFSHAFWGAFWLLSPDHPKAGHVEIDIIEWYGSDPKGHHTAVHIWPVPRSGHAYQSNYIGMPALTEGGWHTYGAYIEPGLITMYLDRKEISRVRVGPEFDVGYYALLSLTLNPGDLPKADDSPKEMLVDYVRAYAPLRRMPGRRRQKWSDAGSFAKIP